MIFINDQSQKYQATLKFLGKEDPQYNNIFVDKTPGAISFLDSTHTFYLAGKLSDPDCYQTMRASLKKFIQRNNFNLLVDIDSFTLDNIEIISAIIEAILEATHPAWTMRSNVQPKTEHYLLKTSYPEIDSLYQRLLVEITSVNLARDLQDGATNIIYPTAFVDIITNKYHHLKNLKISVLNLEDIKKLKMGLFLSVNQGSVDEGKILIVEYHNNPTTTEKTAFIGKGITFDSGGYALKSPSGMVNMRYDMSGAASVISAMYGVSQLSPQINVVALAPLTDNRIGGATTLNTSIVRAMNGKTVQITSTDAEGRMVMADAITYAIQKLQATKIITVATLAGAMIKGLGKYVTGAMATSDELFNRFYQATHQAHETFWQMPVTRENYQAMSNTQYADLVNHSYDKYNPTGNSMAFLDNFTEGLPFLHIDIAGTAYIDDRGKGTMVKSIIEYCLLEGQYYEK